MYGDWISPIPAFAGAVLAVGIAVLGVLALVGAVRAAIAEDVDVTDD